ncbi:GNAT family N-acetyltransferase [Bacillus sp. M6-12]|uniref:GNAT family N-acetyltransferase n=1 Tax=Bacillus sp. M6-12 TaxID=2054166 RepID=UPI000C75E136|nr:GNAT family protein [Bacillus sp. M6-12]PLS15933.1 GNAT family N-acetyltransferase [Bacillus sp. M6-12]
MTLNKSEKKPVRFLEGERVYLRPISIDDAESYFTKLFHAETRKLTGTQKSFTREFIYDYVDRKTKDPTSLLFIIALCDDDSVIGDIAIQDVDSMNRNANIRISIDEAAHQGKGYGKEAMNLMLDYGFGILNLHRIELNVFSYNERAARVYEQLGFTKEGVQRDALYYNHQYHDSIMMSILEDEYRKKRGISSVN